MVDADTDAGSRLPNGSSSLNAVLFVDSSADETPGYIQRFSAQPLPRGIERVVLDVTGAKETALWFGIETAPALALIHRGMLLAIDHTCDPKACERLLNMSREQLRHLSNT